MKRITYNLVCAVFVAIAAAPTYAAEGTPRESSSAPVPTLGETSWQGAGGGRVEFANFKVRLFDPGMLHVSEDRAFSRAFADLSFARHLDQERMRALRETGAGHRELGGYALYGAWEADPFGRDEAAVFSDLSFAFLGDPPTAGIDFAPREPRTDAELVRTRSAGGDRVVTSERLPGSVLAALVALIGLVAVARRNVSGEGRR